MKPLSRAGREREVAGRLHHAAIRLLRHLRREDASTGLTPARASALSVLVFAGPLRLSALAEAEGVRIPTMSRIVSGLVAAGLVRRSRDRRDGRAALLRPTANGRQLLLRARESRLTALMALFAGLPAGDLETLGSAALVLERLVAAPAAFGLPEPAPPSAGAGIGEERPI